MKKILLKVFSFFTLSLLITGNIFAATLVVKDVNQNYAGDTQCSNASYTVIQAAIEDAVYGDEVLVCQGTYYENINFSGTSTSFKTITVISKDGAANTIINGDVDGDGIGDGRVVTFNSGESIYSVLQGFTLTNGVGGIDCRSSFPTINNCTIIGNTATLGGAIYCSSSLLTINNCTMTGNTSGRDGGAIYCLYSSMNMSKCKINGNTAGRSGGAICCMYSSPSISNCTITGNTSGSNGGGIFCYNSSSPSIINCTINGNSSAIYGGGIYCFSYSSPRIINCTVSYNVALNNAGGIYCRRSSNPTGVNNIFWGNSGVNGLDEVQLDGTSSLNITYSDIKGGDINNPGFPYPGVGNIDIDPKFVSFVDNHLSSISPCIDRGTDDKSVHHNLPDDDIDGDRRPLDVSNVSNNPSAYDMGSDEYAASLVLAIDISTSQSSYATGDTLVIDVRITNDNTPDDVAKAIWLEFQDGTKQSFDLGIVNIPANSDTTTTIFSYTFTGSEPAGDYKIGGRLNDTITLEDLSADIETFTFTP